MMAWWEEGLMWNSDFVGTKAQPIGITPREVFFSGRSLGPRPLAALGTIPPALRSLQTPSLGLHWPGRQERRRAGHRICFSPTCLQTPSCWECWLHGPDRRDMLMASSGKTGARAPVGRPTDHSSNPAETPVLSLGPLQGASGKWVSGGCLWSRPCTLPTPTPPSHPQAPHSAVRTMAALSC